MKIFSPPSNNPDHDNYSLFGKAWKDRASGVTELSAQVGSGGKDLADQTERHAHQHKLLAARLNTFIDAAATPARWSRTAIANTQAPHLKVALPAFKDARVLPSLSHARHASVKSFNESKAVSKITHDYLRCDSKVRNEFLEKLHQDIQQVNNNRQLEAKLKQLHAELSNLSEKKRQDLDALATRRTELQNRKEEARTKTGKSRMLAKAMLLLKGTDGELRSIERKTNEIFRPSSYELHRMDNNGDKVSNRPLHVEELKQRALGKSSGPVNGLRTKIDIRNFTETRFDALAGAMRQFHDRLKTDGIATPAAQQALRDAAKPILYSRDRKAVHRFIRDMARQLKRAGVAQHELDRINALTADRHDASWKLAQELLPGIGKQMRLQDEAERMAKALPMLLALTARHGNDLKNQLMQFDLSNVKGLYDYIASPTAFVRDRDSTAVTFVSSPQGKAFIDAVLKNAAEALGPEHFVIRELRNGFGRSDPRYILRLMADLISELARAKHQEVTPDSMLQELIKENRHLFMVTSDAEFWEREAVDKAGTRLVPDQDVHAKDKSRIFKQMKMRAAAMGMSSEEIDAFMIEGIGNTLRNRNMAIAGSRLGGVVGMVPGALAGAGLMNGMKKKRLQEAEGKGNAGRIRFDGDWGRPPAQATYTSASTRLKPAGKRLVKREAAQKPSLTPSFMTGRVQFAQAQVQVWKGMAGYGIDFLWKPARYAFYAGPKDAWKDLVIHNDPKAVAKTRTDYSPASTLVAAPSLRSGASTNRNKDLPDLPESEHPEVLGLASDALSSTDSFHTAVVSDVGSGEEQ